MALHIDEFLSGERAGSTLANVGRRIGKTFLFDIDSTLTMGEQSHLFPSSLGKMGKRIWKSNPGHSGLHLGWDWTEWNTARAGAEPNPFTIQALKDVKAAGYNLLGMTARTREADPITRNWLGRFGIEAPFISRPMHMSEERSAVSKAALLREARGAGFNVIGGMEDSSSNVEMYNRRKAPHVLIKSGQIDRIPKSLPPDIKEIMEHHQTRQISSARRQLMQQEAVPGYIDDPSRTNPYMNRRRSVL